MKTTFSNMTDDELSKYLKEYAEHRDGEISELTYAASIQIAVLSARVKLLEEIQQKPCKDCISRIEVIKSIDEREDVNGKVDAESVRTDIVLMPSVSPQPCEDAINRQWLMECVNEEWIKFDTEKDENRFIHLVRDIAPPVNPKTTGHWIEHPHEAGPCWEYSRYECSECHEWAEDDSNYCPDCGASMESEG